MANWLLFSDTTSKPAPVLVNLDLVKRVQPGEALGTVIIDGMVMGGDFDEVQLAVYAIAYPAR